MSRVCLTQPFTPFPKDDVERSVPARFEYLVRHYPQHLAIKTSTGAMTYEALNSLANGVAYTILTQRGTSPEPVALLLETGILAITALLGVMKTGKFYTLLDVAFPEARLTAMIEDIQPCLVLTDTHHLPLAQRLVARACPVLNIDEYLDPGVSYGNPGLTLAADLLAEIVYTSGSTGRPKGVMHQHRTILHNCMRQTNVLHLSAADRITLFSSLNTGQGRSTMYRALLNGATLYPWPVKQEGVSHLATWLREEAITIYYSSATVFRAFVNTLTGNETFPHLRLLRIGSETVAPRDVELYKAHFPATCLFFNSLSSTETTTTCLYLLNHETSTSGNAVPVGYALEDIEVLLLDEQGAAVGENQPGEIVIKSRYLSPGYWRQPELTAARFLPDPSGGEERRYYTGDLGRMLPDGCLVHLGRKDAQVKVRGYRVEVTEIERVLCEHTLVREAVVLARPNPQGEQSLVAYIVPRHLPGPPLSVLQEHIQKHLPDYMLPAAFLYLEAFPLTPSGKIDRQQLPAPNRSRPPLALPYVAPRTPIEMEVVRIWAETLGLDQVGLWDPFLLLGGDSILAMRIITRVLHVLKVPVPQQQLLTAPTVAQMAEFIVAHMVTQLDDTTLHHLLDEVTTKG